LHLFNFWIIFLLLPSQALKERIYRINLFFAEIIWSIIILHIEHYANGGVFNITWVHAFVVWLTHMDDMHLKVFMSSVDSMFTFSMEMELNTGVFSGSIEQIFSSPTTKPLKVLPWFIDGYLRGMTIPVYCDVINLIRINFVKVIVFIIKVRITIGHQINRTLILFSTCRK